MRAGITIQHMFIMYVNQWSRFSSNITVHFDQAKYITGQLQWRTQEFFRGEGGSTNSVEDRGQRGRGSGGGSPLVRGSGGSCSWVQEISFHIVKFSQFLVL